MGRLEEGLALLGLSADSQRLDPLRCFLSEIDLWNARYGLVKASGDDLVVRHVLDSLVAAPIIERLDHATIADVGAGAGFPGIPIAIYFDRSRVTLIERSGRRAGFLRNAVALCGLAGRVMVFEGDVESAPAGGFSLVTFRALGKLTDVIEPLFRIAEPGGSLVAYKGRSETARAELGELAALRAGGRLAVTMRNEILEVTVPFLHEERTIVVIRRD